MKLLPFVIVGLFWLGAYFVGGWPAVGVMVVLGVCGELVLLLAESRAERRQGRLVARRLDEQRENDALNRILGGRQP